MKETPYSSSAHALGRDKEGDGLETEEVQALPRAAWGGMVGWAKEWAGRALSVSETSSPRAAHIHSFKAAVIKNQRDECPNHQRSF